MRRLAVVLLIASSAAAQAPDRLFFIGSIGKSDIALTVRTLANGEVVGATLHDRNDLRLLRGTRNGSDLTLKEFDFSDHQTATITARLMSDELKGTWQQRPFEFWEPSGNDSPLMNEASLSWPALRRIHDAARAGRWEDATDAARKACGISDEGCQWFEALPTIAQGKLPPGNFQPWKGLLLERSGSFVEAIAEDKRWCGWNYVACLLLSDLLSRMPVDEQNTLRVQLCTGHHISCDDVFGGAQVALADAARRGDVKTVERLLNEGAKVNFGTNGRLLSPLLSATFAKSLPVVKLLLDHGADPDADYGYETSLEFAVGNNLDDIAMLLADHGAKSSDHALYSAVSKRNRALARKIVENGADVDQGVPAGSPLTAAVDNRDAAMVKFLLAHGADPDFETKYSDGSPIDHARRTRQTTILRILLAAHTEKP